MDLIQYSVLNKWKPQHGDVIIFSGWFTRWVGVVNRVSGTEVSIITAGTITELCSYGTKDQEDNTMSLDSEKIKRSRSKYNILQNVAKGSNVWYV